MDSFGDVLGIGSLPPPTSYDTSPASGASGYQNIPAASGSPTFSYAGAPAPSDAGATAPSASQTGLNVPLGPAAGSPAQAAGGLALQQIVGLLRPQQQNGFSLPTFMSSLGAGLSSAGQNWNKPAAAAFASGAGAALQGGQQWQSQLQDAKLKAINAALAAWKIGDMAAFHQMTANIRALSAQQSQPQGAAASGAPAAAGGAPTNNPPAPPASATWSPSGPAIIYGSPASSAGAPPARGGASAPRLSAQDVFAQARDAIARGAPPDAVMQRAREHGFELAGL